MSKSISITTLCKDLITVLMPFLDKVYQTDLRIYPGSIYTNGLDKQQHRKHLDNYDIPSQRGFLRVYSNFQTISMYLLKNLSNTLSNLL